MASEMADAEEIERIGRRCLDRAYAMGGRVIGTASEDECWRLCEGLANDGRLLINYARATKREQDYNVVRKSFEAEKPKSAVKGGTLGVQKRYRWSLTRRPSDHTATTPNSQEFRSPSAGTQGTQEIFRWLTAPDIPVT
jgi:hypothetical protein